MSDIGHNLPPDMSITVGEVAKDLSDWMGEHPVIADEIEAKAAKLLVDRASLAVQDLEDERTQHVRPLNEKVKQINDYYRGPRELLNKVLDVLKDRMSAYLLIEEQKRIAAAAEAQRVADEAERVARGAELREKQQIEDNLLGVVGGDIAGATAEADAKFEEYRKADRAAALAEREAQHVKIGGGYRRSLSLRNKETIIIADIHAAIDVLGTANPRIQDAVISASRNYKRIYGHYPAGITTEVERKA